MPKQRQPGIHLHTTEILKPGKKGKSKSDIHISKEYYWILISRNGKTIARSSETYKRKRSAVRSIEVAADIFTDHYGRYYDHTVITGRTEMVVY